MTEHQHSLTGWFVVGFLFLSSMFTILQLGIISQSYGQMRSWTIEPPGVPTRSHIHEGNDTWTRTGPPWPTGHPGNETWTWIHTTNQSWTWTQTGPLPPWPPGNHTIRTQTGPPGPPSQPENQTGRVRGGIPPGLMKGWAHLNMSVIAKNLTRSLFMNGTQKVKLGYIIINASSSGQLIHHIAFNDSITQITFDRDGSIKLVINASVKPARIFADNIELSEAQFLDGLTAESEAWVYNQTTHTITIFSDPASITIIYNLTPTPPTSTQIPEFPIEFEFVLIGCLVAAFMITKNAKKRSRRAC